MDLFDATDYLEVLPKRMREFGMLVLVVAIATFAPARTWFIGQAERHAQHVEQRILDLLQPVIPAPGQGSHEDRRHHRDFQSQRPHASMDASRLQGHGGH
jgi:hypothetical protein